MTARLGNPPHYFDSNEHNRQHHFPRAYLRNADYNYDICSTLYDNSPMIVQDFPLYFGTSRSEMYREQTIELWRTGLPIAPVRTGAKSYTWHHLDADPTPEKTVLQNDIITRRMSHPYTLLFLDAIRHNGGASQKKLAELLFHTYKKGSLDQVHPTYGDLDVKETKKGKGWGLIENEQLSELGNKVLDAYQGGLVFVCGRTDLANKSAPVRLLWAILREIEHVSGKPWSSYPFPLPSAPHKISFKNISNRFNGPGRGKIPPCTPGQIKSLLTELNLNFKLIDDEIVIQENIYLSITPATYVGAGLSEMDDIKSKLLHVKNKIRDSTVSSSLNRKIWVISNNFCPEKYPNDSIGMKWEDWLDNCRSIDTKTPKAIVFAPEWSPAWIEVASGELHAYVAAGGNVITHKHKSTRTGTSKMFFTGYPQDIDRFSHLPESGWRFDTNLGRRIGDPAPIYTNEFYPANPSNKPMNYFRMGYGGGCFHFYHDDPSKSLYDSLSLTPPNNFTDSVHWKWRRIANLYRDPEINREPDTYPILGNDILKNHLKFKLSETFAHHYKVGVAEQNWCDLVILAPAPVLFEVDTLGGGKRSKYGSISGGSTGIDDMHVQRQSGWQSQAQRWISKYLTLIDKSKQSRTNLQCGWILNQIPKVTRTDREEFFIKELHLYHYSKIQTEGRTPNILDLELSLLSALERIGGRPGSLVIGTNYGWQEGLKSSARETAIDNGTSLWTFLDLYEFLVRTDNWNVEDRQQAFIDILAKDGGPVCWEIAKL